MLHHYVRLRSEVNEYGMYALGRDYDRPHMTGEKWLPEMEIAICYMPEIDCVRVHRSSARGSGEASEMVIEVTPIPM